MACRPRLLRLNTCQRTDHLHGLLSALRQSGIAYCSAGSNYQALVGYYLLMETTKFRPANMAREHRAVFSLTRAGQNTTGDWVRVGVRTLVQFVSQTCVAMPVSQ
jgi:hypothetical protein